MSMGCVLAELLVQVTSYSKVGVWLREGHWSQVPPAMCHSGPSITMGDGRPC